ncbi:MlaD family protein [Dethiosulfatarculus sandiegensis]|uniref:Mce/MlaD domain-containing protein n=1 Tax=Dethiosulfatarculus sandiegensis TaxID=1429043 RepID=A0A0D2HLY6_9BACT|nr:MlaD family protein [Dethiosulfatarculus sandiegensis]KIX11598.1 hypothetical protein X474_24985 [Dethiosulfatarculus sandiegensis]
MAGFSTEAKVGVFVMLGLAVLAYMTIRLGSFEFGEPKGIEISAVFDNATGLKKNAPVEMAGIEIGRVKTIGLENGKARVTMLVDSKVPLAADSKAFIRTRGVLGDKYLALEPGNPAAPKLKQGGVLAKAEVPTDLDRVMARVGEIADDVKAITSSLKVSLASPQSQRNISESLQNIREITASLKVVVADNQDRLTKVIANLDRFTTDLSQISGQNKDALGETITNFRNISAKLDHTINGLTSVVEKIDKGEGTIGGLINDRQTLDDLNSTLASLKEVTKKIDQGKGTLGRLVNDDTTINKIDDVLTGVNEYITQADAWRVNVDYRGEYLFGESALRNTLSVRLQPKADKFYLLGVVTDPVGRRSDKKTVSHNAGPDGTYTTVQETTTYDRDEIGFNAQIGKRFYDLTARAGIFNTTGGVGLDYHMLDDNLKFTFEAYDFRIDTNPHLKVAVDYTFWNYFYVTAGADDFISDDDHATFFLGAGVTFYDEDLKFLLTKAPMP